MSSLHESQEKILEYVLDHPEGATLDELALRLGVTKTAAKEHIIKLSTAGFLTFTDTRGAVGRPRRRYVLTPEGHETFPRKYAWLSTILLELLAEELGGKALAEMMRKLADKVAQSMESQLSAAKSDIELFRLLNLTLNELGYRTTLKQADLKKGAVLEATNCVYHTVAKAHPALCTFDTRFIERATGGMNVRLESCIARGGTVCRFCINQPQKIRSRNR